MSNECVARFLEDDPASLDELGGAHGRLARALADVVAESYKGKLIGLVGTWGSGKSTVVHLLERDLEDDTTDHIDAVVFNFNAWQHEGDPLRRTFLESLIGRLQEQEWLPKESFDKERETLARRREYTEVKSEPVLTWAGWLTAVSLLIVPFGDALVAARKPLVWGVLVSGVPILAIGLLALFRKKKPGESPWTAALRGLINRDRMITHSTALRTPDPTSLEFENLFRRIIESALQRDDQRLVIVMDNLDRVPATDAAKLWTTMRMFTDVSLSARTPWVIVPYAPGTTPSGSTSGSDEGARSFEEKTFPIIMRLPPPLLSEWQTYFDRKFVSAFPNHAGEQYSVYRLYRDIVSRTGDLPTPRSVKTFLNRLVALHRLWGHVIPLPTQAAYVAMETVGNAEKIAEAKPLSGFLALSVTTALELGDPNYYPHLAALHTGIETRTAAQVLALPRIQAAFEAGDGDQLRELELPNLGEYCLEVIKRHGDIWAKNEPELLFRSCLAMSDIATLSADWASAWTGIARCLQFIKSPWPDVVVFELASAVAALIRHAPASERAAVIDQVLSGWGTGSVADDEAGTRWAKSVAIVLSAIRDVAGLDAVSEGFKLPGDATATIAILGTEDIETDILGCMARAADSGAVIGLLVQKCQNNEIHPVDVQAVRVLSGVAEASAWSPVRQAIGQRLGNHQTPMPGNITDLMLQILVESCHEGAALLDTLRPTMNGPLLAHLSGMMVGRNTEGLAVVLAGMLMTKVVPTPQQAAWNTGNTVYMQARDTRDARLLTAIASDIARLWTLPAFLDQCHSSPYESLNQAVVNLIVSRHLAMGNDWTEDLLSHWGILSQWLEESIRRQAIGVALDAGRLHELLPARPFDAANHGVLYLDVVDHLVRDGTAEKPELIDWFVSNVRNATKDEWIASLGEGSNDSLIELAARLQTISGVNLELGIELMDALAERLRQTRPSMDNEIGGQLQLLVRSLRSSNRTTFLRDALDNLIKRPEIGANAVVWLGPMWLEQTKLVANKADELARTVWPWALEHESVVLTLWLLSEFSKKSVVKNCPVDSMDTLLSRLHEVKDEDWITDLRAPLTAVVADLQPQGLDGGRRVSAVD